MSARRPIIIDCDPGIDDAIALMLAYASPEELEVLAVTTVAGNVPLSLTEPNARRIRDLCGAYQVPVFAGCPRPLLRPLVTADHVHGDTGLAGVDWPKPGGFEDPRHAVDILRDTIAERPGEVTVVAVGPLTNLAVALTQRPELAREVREIVIMGGAAGAGNTTPHAEFNFHVDPHAAHIVFQCGAPIAMYGLDITRQARADADWLRGVREFDTAVARAAAGMLSFYNANGGALHDVLAVAHLIWPDLFTLEPCRVEIEIDDQESIGKSHVAQGMIPALANAKVGFGLDAPAFLDALADRLSRYTDR